MNKIVSPQMKLDRSQLLYRQIYETIRSWILTGRYRAGERLPSTRSIASSLNVSRNTALLAYEQLIAEGYCSGSIGSGTYVNSSMEKSILIGGTPNAQRSTANSATPALSSYAKRVGVSHPFTASGSVRRPHFRYDFQYGLPGVGEFPHEVWQKLVSRRARASSMQSLRYGPAAGYLPLRQVIADYLRRARGVSCGPDEIVIVNGSQQALDLAARLLLDPNDDVIIEDPHYQGARQVFQAAGAKLIAAQVDEEGLNISGLPKSAESAKLVYVTPSHQFPTGGIMPAARRLALLAWARKNNSYILEDDYDGEYRYEGWPVAAIQGLDQAERVLYVGTFSKSLFPSIRIGFLVIPKTLIKHFTAAKWLADRQTSTLEQEVLTDFIQEGHFEKHLRRSRMKYASRRKVLLQALEQALGNRVQISGASAGVHLLVWIKNMSQAQLNKLIEGAAKEGVGLYSILPYYLNPPKNRAGLLFGYASLTEDAIRNGVRIFAKLV